MKKDIDKARFAELIFYCPECKVMHQIDVTKKVDLQFNHGCECGAKFFINRTKGRVAHINNKD